MTLADRLRAGLVREASPQRMGGDDMDHIPAENRIPAAVLVAVTDRTVPGVLLTLRQPHLRRHAGQISFPGGRIDPGDDGPVAAALREAHEEIGLEPGAVDLIGATDTWSMGNGFVVVPVVGVIAPDLPLVPHEGEVAAIFEVPLEFLLEPRNHALKTIEWQGRERRIHEIQWQDRRIWGATAGMIVNLSRRLAEAMA